MKTKRRNKREATNLGSGQAGSLAKGMGGRSEARVDKFLDNSDSVSNASDDHSVNYQVGQWDLNNGTVAPDVSFHMAPSSLTPSHLPMYPSPALALALTIAVGVDSNTKFGRRPLMLEPMAPAHTLPHASLSAHNGSTSAEGLLFVADKGSTNTTPTAILDKLIARSTSGSPFPFHPNPTRRQRAIRVQSFDVSDDNPRQDVKKQAKRQVWRSLAVPFQFNLRVLPTAVDLLFLRFIIQFNTLVIGTCPNNLEFWSTRKTERMMGSSHTNIVTAAPRVTGDVDRCIGFTSTMALSLTPFLCKYELNSSWENHGPSFFSI
ncbi:hypothetical protein JAAARDRAFT_686037 [Jaapia argillacea MUCL 33604]|uniref:Uncharacterized protein n=1 Tax=Jaapia argillacea MUCL 33604 TaxID=933084 RepID=A0A067PW68_9AGAM|nr:hypothetical protein JAAARDRAFT_686037 [Jaapia argillacea MUCL 33604]